MRSAQSTAIRKADRIVEVWTFSRRARRARPTSAVVATLRKEPGLFEAVGAYQFGAGTITGTGGGASLRCGLAPSVFQCFRRRR